MTKQTCSFVGCKKSFYALNLCSGHYSQHTRGKELTKLTTKTKSYLEPCSFVGCKNNRIAKGLCSAHWRQQNLGKELTTLTNQVSLIDRILSSVNKTDYCWLWEGRSSGTLKYPQISVKGRQQMVHRLVYEELVRPLKPGETIDHLCRERMCVNPKHLEAVPLRDNVKRMHAYRSILRENARLVAFIESLGYDSNTLEKRTDNANISNPPNS